MEKFSQRVFHRIEPIWAGYLNHPFVAGLGDGTLAQEKFARWVKQDYRYLTEFARLFALGVAKAPTLAIMQDFAHGLHEILFMEMDLHRSFAKKYGIREEDLEVTLMWPSNQAYTSYMLNRAQAGGPELAITAILTCVWSYQYVGQALARGEVVAHNPYQAWIDLYASQDFAQLSQSLIDLLDNLTQGKPERELAQLEEIMVITSYYEERFWDMCEHGESWGDSYGLETGGK